MLLGSGAGLALGAGAGLTDSRVRSHLRRFVVGDPQSPHAVPTGNLGPVLTGSFRSTAMSATTGWSIGYPEGVKPGTPLPFLLVLHGRNNDHRDVLGVHRLGAFLAAAVREGVAPFAVVGVDGGSHSYWHRRRSGEDPQRMVLKELLPLLADRALRTDRFALGGWSMGGYGALLLAQHLGPARVCAVAVDSPALWRRATETAPGAFDDAQDFSENDVLADASRLAAIPLRVTCGTSDPFIPGVRALLARLPEAERDLAPGVHDVAWWQHAAPAQLAFVGRHFPR